MDQPPRFDPSAAGRADRPIGDLVRDLAAESSTLIRQEITLARTEVRRNLRSLAGDLTQLALGGAIAAAGALTLVAAIVVLLGGLLGGLYWTAAAIVAVVLLLIGGLLAWRGASSLQETGLAPTATAASLRTTQRWAGEEIAELRSAVGGQAPSADGVSPRAAAGLVAPPPHRAEDRIGIVRRDGGASAGRKKERRGRADSGDGLVKRVWTGFQEDDVLGQAGKVGFFAFMSLPPAILVIFALTGFFGGDRAANWLTEQLQRALPEGASELVDGFVTQIVHEQAPGPFSIGLVLALWAASAVFVSLTYALNDMYGIEEGRSWIRLRAITLGVMLACAVLLLGGAALLLAGPVVAGALDLAGAADLAWAILQWPLAFLLVVAAFWLIYYVLPNRDQSFSKLVLLKSSAIAALLWILATAGFRLYVANFASYSETYGALGAVIVLLFWLYITAIVILVGGELNSEMEEART
jgi:membrane protein